MLYSPPADTGLDIIFEDKDILVLNKPSGLLSVPGKAATHQDSLALRVQARYPEALITHRLDMETSGLILMARSSEVHRAMSILFQARKVHKTYVAVVDGIIKENAGSVDLPLICDWPNRPRQKIDYETGKASLTHYSVLDRDTSNQTTRVQLEPVTGRSHQLRVHMLTIGHAILGDQLYASVSVQKKSPRLLLHASGMTFHHPVTGDEINSQSAVPF
jgi:tRNA pseudouridine32 synthase/23S rRNA pseudouridine746 synthase